MKLKDIRQLYTKMSEGEWNRLFKHAANHVEFETTIRYLKKYLPKKGRILDAGGGPGRYTIELAKLGYKLTLLDYTPALLDVAKEKIKEAGVSKNVEKILEGSITDLSMFEDNSFDAVICVGGPLSHVKKSEQKKAVSELVRVAKKGAPIFITVMGKIGVLFIAALFPKEIEDTKHIRDLYKKGDDVYFIEKGHYCHFFTPEELKKLFENKLNVVELIGVEGIVGVNEDRSNEVAKNKKAWKNWMEMHYATCTDPHVVALSQHIMMIGRK